MKIMLIHPTYYSSPDCNPNSIYRSSPPLGLGYLASILHKAGHEIMIFDVMGRNKEIPMRIQYFKPEVIGISTMTNSYPQAYELCHGLRKAGYKGYIVIGGVHPSVAPEQTWEQLKGVANCLVIGEAEGNIVEIVEKKPTGIIHGVPIENLDDIPFPAWDMFELSRYSSPNLPIMTARGCPFNCIFCSSKFFWKTVKFRSIENVRKELEYLKTRTGTVMIYDDTFMLKKERVLEFTQICKELGLRYRCNGRVNILANATWDEVLDEMKGTCIQVDLGVESYSQKVLDKMNKQIKRRDIVPVFEKLYERGIGANCYLIVSNVGESDDDRETTLTFANYLKHLLPGVRVDIQLLRKYPNTPLSQLSPISQEVDWIKSLDTRLRYPNVPIYLENESDRDKIVNEFLQAKQFIVGW